MQRHRLVLAPLLLSAFATGSAAAAAPPLFEASWRAFGVGEFPNFAPTMMALGDVDGDGIIDIVACREYFSGPGISVLRGRSDGSYEPREIYTLPSNQNCGDVVLVDFNGNGHLDAIATVRGSSGLDSRIAVWRNNGDGTFMNPIYFNAGNGPVGLVAGDFNGDGYPDIVTADRGYSAGNNNTISLLLHNGLSGAQSGFLPPAHLQVGVNCMRVVAGDLNGNGHLDIVVGRGSFTGGAGGVAVLFNDGQANFTAPVHVNVGTHNRYSPAVALVDIDNDGDLDILHATANQSAPYGTVHIRRNDGNGNFGTAESINLPQWTFTPWQVAAGDLNGDGFPDIIASTPSGRANDGYNVILSDGSGGFHPAVRYEAGKQTFDLAVHDADGDGHPDVLTVANDSSVITVHSNLGDGTFLVLPRYLVGVLAAGFDYGDITGNGHLDIVTSHGSQVYILLNNGDGTFATATTWATPMVIADIKLRDLNNNGLPDLVMASSPNAPPYHFATALNNGNGSFNPGVITHVFACQGGEVEAVDLNNNGFADVVLTEPGACAGGTTTRIYIARNNGNGTSFTLMQPIITQGLPWGIGWADFNHDGFMDLVSSTAEGLTVYPGRGDFTFDPHIPSGQAAYRFSITHLDDDGNHDIAFIEPQPSFGTVRIGTMLGFGDGTLGSPEFFTGATGREGAFRISNTIITADVDGDGLTDVTVISNASNDVSVHLGSGDGALRPNERYGAGYAARFGGVADFTGDGRSDVATVIALPPGGFQNAVVILRGLEPPSTTSERATLTGFSFAFGQHVEGVLSDLIEPDESYLTGLSQFGFSAQEPNILDLRVTAQTTLSDAESLDVTFKGRLNNPGGAASLRLKEWKGNSFVLIDQFPIGSTEIVHVVSAVAASAYVRAGDGALELSLRQSVVATFSAQGFTSYTDQIAIDLRAE